MTGRHAEDHEHLPIVLYMHVYAGWHDWGSYKDPSYIDLFTHRRLVNTIMLLRTVQDSTFRSWTDHGLFFCLLCLALIFFLANNLPRPKTAAKSGLVPQS